ncbi:MAG: hypothetical protein K2O67_06875, partial [Clostridia bacterium]|nr:hypothetical protein [Clostridia bacterium]
AKYPVASAAEVNVCDRPEIIRVLNILAYLENGEQDVPLAAALLSPLGGLDEFELAQTRIYGGADMRDKPLRACVKKYAEQKADALSEKLSAFFERIERLRTLSKSLGAARLIDEIVCTGNFAAAFDSEQKLAALRRLQREAYAPTGELYLSAFLAKIKAGGYKILAQPALGGDCVKVMTMHASKGLEFPVVIIADVAADFSGDDKTEMPYDKVYGFAPRSFDAQSRSYSPTVLRRLVKMQSEKEELSNEINLFYVACTRAKYKLYVLTSRAESYDSVRAPFAENYADLFDVKSFNPRILAVQPSDLRQNEGVERVLDESRAASETYEELKNIAGFKYPYALGFELPVKSSASHLLHLKSGEETAKLLFDEEFAPAAKTGVDAGVAYHRFLELCDFSKKGEEQVSAQIQTWLKDGLISEEQQKLLSVKQLAKILSMPAFGELDGKNLYREREFVCRLPSAEYSGLTTGGAKLSVGEDDGNGVIVQGAIDLLAVERKDGKAVAAHIIDYKYSGMSDEYLRDHYAPQLALYKAVVCKIYALDESNVKTTVINIRACRQLDLD